MIPVGKALDIEAGPYVSTHETLGSECDTAAYDTWTIYAVSMTQIILQWHFLTCSLRFVRSA